MSILGNTTAVGDPSGNPPAQSFDTGATPTPSPAPSGVDTSNDLQEAQAQGATQPTSRLQAIISAVAKVGEAAFSGIPATGRPSFASGLGQGARAEQAAQAQQQAIKFKTFDDQVRLAQLHNQDLKMQNDTQEQQDAHVKAELDNRKLANDLGIDYDTIANHSSAVMDHLTAQTAANGAASVPAGTHISADGQNIYIPTDTQDTRDGQKRMYSELSPALGLPSLPDGAQIVPDRLMNMLTNKLHGFGLDGTPIKHDDLPGVIGAEKQQRAQLAKNGATAAQLQTLDNVIAIHQANLDALDSHAASVKQQSKQAELDAENSPQSIAGAAKKAGAVANAELPSKIALENAKQQNASTLGYAYDPKSDTTVAVTADDAKAQGLTTWRKVNQTQISSDTHNASVLNDVAMKANSVAQAAPALDQNSKQRDIISWALGDNGIKIGFGDHLALPMDALVNNSLNSRNMGQATPLTKQYIIGVLSLREAAMGMNRVLTGSARASETQIKALQATLPGFDPDSQTALQRLQSFGQNVEQLRKPIPRIPGVPVIPVNIGGSQPAPSGSSNLGRAVTQNPTGYINSLQPTQ